MKITVLFTGGTIGSQANGSVLDVSEKATPRLIWRYYEERPNNSVKFSYETLFSALSENITVSHWKEIFDRVKNISKKECDGIIITHGTDTLAFTATFLSFMLKQIDVPIFLISSDYPVDDDRANGIHNFIAAIDFIEKVGTNGVFVPFKKNGTTNIHLGARLLQAHPFLHSFSSLGNIVYGSMANGEFERHAVNNNPTPEDIERQSSIIIPHFPDEKRILYLKPYLGLDYSILDFKNKPDVIIHGLYHSGTACANPDFEKNSIIVFAKRCIAQGIDFYAAPYDSQHPMYSTSKAMEDVGIKFIDNISCVAAYTKLLIAYGSFSDLNERQKFIDTNIACEQFG